jgi:hypothetical protein
MAGVEVNFTRHARSHPQSRFRRRVAALKRDRTHAHTRAQTQAGGGGTSTQTGTRSLSLYLSARLGHAHTSLAHKHTTRPRFRTANHAYTALELVLVQMKMWRAVVGAGWDLLALDLDFNLKRSPVPQLHALTAPTDCPPHTPASRCHVSRVSADVVAAYDGPRYKLLNVGNIWIRSTSSTRALVDRVANRTWLGWDQLILTEELAFNRAFAGIGCCHTRCFRSVGRKGLEVVDKTKQGYAQRIKLEGGKDVCEARVAHSALGPPTGTRYKWNRHICYKCPANSTPGWTVDNYNAMSENYLRYGKCSAPSHACQGWEGCAS